MMFQLDKSTESAIFDFKALRFLMGLIALALPYAVIWISSEKLSSISASYYTNAQDIFVGMLFVVSAFLWAYNGHTRKQKIASKLGSVAAILVAIFPTACDGCTKSFESTVHFVAALTLFLSLAYFCLGPFRKYTKVATEKKKRRRATVYLICGWLMILAMLCALVAKIALSTDVVDDLRIIYYVELVALNAFGVAWITAGKWLPFLVDKENEDALVLVSKS